MEYVIRLNDDGYYGGLPWTPVPREDAIVFDSMKKARKSLNRINGRLIKDGCAEIEKK